MQEKKNDPTNGHNNAMQSPAAPPPLLAFDGYAGELLVSHHASSRTPLPAHTARKHYSCFGAANSAFPYAPGSSPNTKRTSRRRSLKPKLHSTEPRRPIASPITVSKSTCQRPLFLTQLARPVCESPRCRPRGPSSPSLRTQPHSQRASPHALFRPAIRSRLPAVYKRHWSPTKYSQE